MQDTYTRWGVVGAAQIARKNWLAILNSGNGVVAAVASRKLESAMRFIDDCQAQAPFPFTPSASGSYAELIAAPDIDAVYIPLPTALRKEWVLAAAKAGKHVLCEKPCAVRTADLEEMVAACQRNGVQFMDGVMFMHSRRLETARAAMPETVGTMRRLNLAFTFNQDKTFFTTNIRANSALEPHGCVGDLAWYCIRFALWAVDWKMPRQVTGRLLTESKRTKGGGCVPTEFSGELLFDKGISAGFYASFITENQQLAMISGDRGYLRIDDFVLPFFGNELEFTSRNTSFAINNCTFNMEPGLRRWTTPEYSNNHPNAQESNMFRNFAAQIQSGRLNTDWPEWALKTQKVMDGCLESARRKS
ncbi:MAG TPA: Gfo/Idh/MocA family oxidoreductase [Verrucomicrobiae bacterium]|jgi:predicted dehydrogenase